MNFVTYVTDGDSSPTGKGEFNWAVLTKEKDLITAD